MSSWRIICIVVLFMILQTNGNPLTEKTSEEKPQEAFNSNLIRRIRNDYVCNYYANPSYDQYDFYSPLSSTGYLISLRSLREQCRYFEEPSQKYSVWDLVR